MAGRRPHHPLAAPGRRRVLRHRRGRRPRLHPVDRGPARVPALPGRRRRQRVVGGLGHGGASTSSPRAATARAAPPPSSGTTSTPSAPRGGLAGGARPPRGRCCGAPTCPPSSAARCRAGGSPDPPWWRGDLLLLETSGGPGRALGALNRLTGEVVWTSQSDPGSYSSPVAVDLGGVRQAVFFMRTGLVAVSPTDGRLLWRREWDTPYGVNAATPLVIPPDGLFISSGYEKGAALVRVSRDGEALKAETAWTHPLHEHPDQHQRLRRRPPLRFRRHHPQVHLRGDRRRGLEGPGLRPGHPRAGRGTCSWCSPTGALWRWCGPTRKPTRSWPGPRSSKASDAGPRRPWPAGRLFLRDDREVVCIDLTPG